MSGKVRAHVIVEGLVQGVYFRANTKRVAEEHDVNGWVRNRPDGSVEAVFEGTREDVERVIAWCHRGPWGARVDDVKVEWEDYKGEFTGFTIRY